MVHTVKMTGFFFHIAGAILIQQKQHGLLVSCGDGRQVDKRRRDVMAPATADGEPAAALHGRESAELILMTAEL